MSIILTTLNSARFVERSIRSCLDQTHRELELIVVDGGSTDGTLAIVEAVDDPRIRLVHQADNTGRLPGAINIGMAESRGAFITWTQDDCWYEPHAIATMLNFLDERPDVGMVYTDYWDVDEGGRRKRYQRVEASEQMTEHFRGDVTRQSFLFRREIYETIGPQDTRYFPVHEVVWRLFVSRFFLLKELHVPLMYYMVHDRSLTGQIGDWELQRLSIGAVHRAGLIDRSRYRKRSSEIDVHEAFARLTLEGDFRRFRWLVLRGVLRQPHFARNRGMWKLMAMSFLPGRREFQKRMKDDWLRRDAESQIRHASDRPVFGELRSGTQTVCEGCATFSVVIPTFNRSAFLADAISSVLKSVSDDDQVIVVDDGSTDDTGSILQSFENRVMYVRLPVNEGPAAARNAGIRLATRSHVAFLDADDTWLESFVPSMKHAIFENPEADAVFCGAQCIDGSGHELPQRAGGRLTVPDELLKDLLRANFILPSTIVLKRTSIEAAGVFDPAFRRFQDYDLWLRMLRMGMKFVNVDKTLVRYRLHSANLSNETADGQRAFAALIQKHYGSLDSSESADEWTLDKRRIVAGYYRYCALTEVVRRQNWAGAAVPLAEALATDSTLARDRDLFYELALGSQPLGWRGTREHIDVRANAAAVNDLLAMVFGHPIGARLTGLRRPTYGTAFRALADVAWNVGEPEFSRKYWLETAKYDRRALSGRDWWRGFVRTFAPRRVVNARRARSGTQPNS